MRAFLWLAVVAGMVSAAAQAQTVVHPHRVHAQRLPGLSGTLRMAPDRFGHAGHSALLERPYARREARLPQVVTGGLLPRLYGTTAGYGLASSYQSLTPAERWATGGTGLRGLIGNTGNPFAGQARWGTADSATSGPGFGGGAWSTGYGRPLVERYGEPAIYPTAYDAPAYGAAPQLGFYGSGTPYTMSYYSSGSSAGPYGSPGGLATYRSGSYGYGPRVIAIPRRTGYGYGYGRGCTCGPRIIHLGRRHRPVAVD